MNIHQPVVAQYIGPSRPPMAQYVGSAKKPQLTWGQSILKARRNAVVFRNIVSGLFWTVVVLFFGIMFVIFLVAKMLGLA